MYPAFQESKRLNENLCCFAVAISIECLNENLCRFVIAISIKFQTNNSDSKLAFVHHPVILG